VRGSGGGPKLRRELGGRRRPAVRRTVALGEASGQVPAKRCDCPVLLPAPVEVDTNLDRTVQTGPDLHVRATTGP
jgi:hypothetical protein